MRGQVARPRAAPGGPLEQLLELGCVNFVAVQMESVAGFCGLDGADTQDLAKPNDTALHHLAGRGGLVVPPECLRDGLAADRGTQPEHKDLKGRPVPRTKGHRTPVDLQGTEDADPHEHRVTWGRIGCQSS